MVKAIKWKENNDIKIYFIGDMHIGSRTFAKKEFGLLIKKINREKNARIILMGDHIEAIESDDTRRYDPNCVDKKLDTADKQNDTVLKYFKPLRKKIIGVLAGNHETVFSKHHKDQFNKKARNHAERLANKLKVNFLEDLGVINLTVGKKQNFNIVVAHGVGTGGTIAGQMRALKNIINSFNIVPNIAVLGHFHSLQTIVNPKMDFGFKTKINHLGISGSFYKTYIEGNMNYASSSLYNPLPIGCIMYELRKDGSIKDNKLIF